MKFLCYIALAILLIATSGCAGDSAIEYLKSHQVDNYSLYYIPFSSDASKIVTSDDITDNAVFKLTGMTNVKAINKLLPYLMSPDNQSLPALTKKLFFFQRFDDSKIRLAIILNTHIQYNAWHIFVYVDLNGNVLFSPRLTPRDAPTFSKFTLSQANFDGLRREINYMLKHDPQTRAAALQAHLH